MIKINSKDDLIQSLLASLVKYTSYLYNSSTMQCFTGASYGWNRLISVQIKK
jgi:hypothetical protein